MRKQCEDLEFSAFEGWQKNMVILHIVGRWSAQTPACKKALTIKVQPSVSGNKHS